jgi:hypothetical protein
MLEGFLGGVCSGIVAYVCLFDGFIFYRCFIELSRAVLVRRSCCLFRARIPG